MKKIKKRTKKQNLTEKKKKLVIEKLVPAYRDNLGNLSKAAKEIKISYSQAKLFFKDKYFDDLNKEYSQAEIKTYKALKHKIKIIAINRVLEYCEQAEKDLTKYEAAKLLMDLSGLSPEAIKARAAIKSNQAQTEEGPHKETISDEEKRDLARIFKERRDESK